MTNFKRFSAAIAATLMAATLSVPMMVSNAATDATTGNTITVTDTKEFKHSAVSAYQLFAGSYSDNIGLNITGWGDGINAENFVKALQASSAFDVEGVNPFDAITIGDGEEYTGAAYTDATVAVAVANVIDAFADNSTQAEAVARIALDNVSSTTSGTYDKDAMTVSQLPDGYYVFADTSAATHENPTASSYSLGMLKVVGDSTLTVTTKIDYPTFTKEINDINDTNETAYSSDATTGALVGGTWGTDADHDINDGVAFKLTATLPSNYDDYTTYKLVFHDDLQADVFDLVEDSFVMYLVDGDTKTPITGITPVTSGLSTDANFASGQTDGTKDFTITFDDVKTAVSSAGAGDQIVIEYKATLTENAKLGTPGNWNSAYLEYSNDPNYIGEGTQSTANTPEETVVAFTYKTEINKIDGVTEQPLAGAGFTLYKKNKAGEYVEVKKISAGTDTKFEFIGLDDGDYKLVESTVPANYNGMADIEFTITGVHSDKALTTLNGIAADSESTIINLGTSTQQGTVDLANGTISATVKNNKGSELPGTGGIGTTLFYLGGGAMVAVAGIYLISKKRMKNSEE